MLRKTLIGCGAVALLSLGALRFVDAPSGSNMSGDFGASGGYYSETSAAKYEEADEEEEEEALLAMQAGAYHRFGDAAAERGADAPSAVEE
jgi:hypothetical protein